uniref:Uncharacterized protein n=1 Tax=uncultured Desulfobacterium sp. TaxID=201089 RepID=E1YDH9_9BACT|nr:unknown protein [uncultured Desulfobacterium sp.]
MRSTRKRTREIRAALSHRFMSMAMVKVFAVPVAISGSMWRQFFQLVYPKRTNGWI